MNEKYRRLNHMIDLVSIETNSLKTLSVTAQLRISVSIIIVRH